MPMVDLIRDKSIKIPRHNFFFLLVNFHWKILTFPLYLQIFLILVFSENADAQSWQQNDLYVSRFIFNHGCSLCKMLSKLGVSDLVKKQQKKKARILVQDSIWKQKTPQGGYSWKKIKWLVVNEKERGNGDFFFLRRNWKADLVCDPKLHPIMESQLHDRIRVPLNHCYLLVFFG